MSDRLRDRFRIVCLAGAALGTASCGTNGAPPTGPVERAATLLIGSQKPWVYVANANYDSPSITVYAKRSHGNAAPLATIAGSQTELVNPVAVAVDGTGNIYVGDEFAGTISQEGTVFVFPPNANGNFPPVAAITQGVVYPFGLAFDSKGNLYVANWQGGSITEYARQSYQLIRTISGGSTGLYPVGVALDAQGRIYVLSNCICSSGFVSITVYARSASGNTPPLRTIYGYQGDLTNALGGIAVDRTHEIYVANTGPNSGTVGGSVLVFGARAKGYDKPVRTIAGPKTELTSAYGLALDERGRIYVTNENYFGRSSNVVVFASNANGNIAPIREIAGSKTGLHDSEGVAVP